MPDAQPPFRRLLMLQGPVGPFFWLLARRLRRQGVKVWKVNLNAGDTVYFPGPNVRAYRGRPDGWPDYLRGLLQELEVDAVALFGDSRAYHSAAIVAARAAGIPTFVFEEGYIRPDYVTVELNGVNGNSGLIVPRDLPGDSGAAPPQGPALDPGHAIRVGNTFPALVLHCMAYWSAMDLGLLFYPHYRHHKPRSLAEIRPWLRSAYRKLRHASRDKAEVARLLKDGTPYFVVPLQVHRDSQIMRDCGFLSVGHFIVTVMESFAKKAPVDHVLVLKQHPMDRGFTDYTALVAHTAERLGCAGRAIYIRDANLPQLLQNARGTITANSTVGLSSLYHGTPVKALGRAVYDRPGLTAQCELPRFWTDHAPVDRQRVQAFMSELIATCQANGSFYARWRQTGAVQAAVGHMAAQYVSKHLGAVGAPPHLKRPTPAAESGIVTGTPPRRRRPGQAPRAYEVK